LLLFVSRQKVRTRISPKCINSLKIPNTKERFWMIHVFRFN